MSDMDTQLVILARGLQSAADEMAANLIRSAFSAVVREARDCSTALLDAEGRVVAQADMIPMQTAGLSESFRCAAEQLDLSGVTEDDFILLNDPYSGGQHLNDLIVFTPILHEGALIGWAGSTAHHLDIGGGSVGVNTTATELLQEGIVIPPLRLSKQRDWFGGMVERFFFANIRTPEIGRGDLDAQFAANLTGSRRVLEMVARHGADTVRAAMTEVMDYSERRMRAAIAALPDGSWEGEAFMDSDGVTPDVPVPVRVRVTVRGDEAELDFTGTAAQVRSMFNAPFACSMAGALTALRSLLGDTGMPANDGCNRPVTLIFPEGSLLNPRPGAPVRARGTASGRVLDAVHQALAPALPDRAPAQGMNATTGVYLARARPEGGYDIHLDVLGGGWGAAKGYEGIHATDYVLSSCRLTPSESIEMLNAHVRIEATALVEDGWGAGEFNGGMGVLRRYRVLADDVVLNLYSDHFTLPPRGIAGGSDGGCASLTLLRDGETRALGATSSVTLQRGDVVEIRLAGGGGWGDPRRRPREAVARDLADGVISESFAAREYGYLPTAADHKEKEPT
ncbi:hydantoinase B/oxoprolinase family protein [Salipiger mucosus]|uniref:N-methylhydantoinase B n=1 Tax=Salipiger mucosus DSM 16094 TaxID=1123237 RepID=S9S2B4_9RHOB|nr:hydantoinase B/oxoprolinase family protein [Salipiger mucosus]EPX80354.1 N-methylhydantoinase B [Salipiger mucosus DSM 16094]